MKLIEGVDYRVRYVEFPNTGSPSVAVSNGDGTYTVYVNTRFSIEEQARGLRHELEHLEGGHFERSGDDLAALESAADGLLKLVPPSGRGRLKRSGGRDIPLYADGDELLEDILNRVSPESLRLLREAGLIPSRGDDTTQ
ncbi:MAG TPA: hypothetical protein IAD43_01805 [Candidatus Scatomorpha pullicola]|nr:hypothetical protein [Candidatus Scatomorpha pullicola]